MNVFSIISGGEYKNWIFWLVEKLVMWRHIHPARAWLLTSPFLLSRQVNMAGSCWMKFRKTSLQVQDIWKDEEFSKCPLSPLDQNSFEKLVFKAFKNLKSSGGNDRQKFRSTDRFFFFNLKQLIFRRWWWLWMMITTIK